MTRYVQAAYLVITLAAVGMVIWMAAYSPSARCANTPHRVYLTDQQVCLPLNAFTPAR